jgi:hypothetical protein
MENSPFAHHFLGKPWIFPYLSQVTRGFTHHKFSLALPHLPPKGDVILLVNDLQVRIEVMGLIFFGPQESQESVGSFW